MPQDLTARCHVLPVHRSPWTATYQLELWENFCPVWKAHQVQNPAVATQLVAGVIGHQFAVGLLSYLLTAAPAALAANTHLARLVAVEKGRLVSKRLVANDAHEVYRVAADLVEVDVTLFHSTCIRISDLRHARHCGLLLRVTDTRPSQKGAHV